VSSLALQSHLFLDVLEQTAQKDVFVLGHVIQCLELVCVHVDSKVQTVLKPVQRAGTEIIACTGVPA